MKDIFYLLLTSVLVNNLILVQFLGLCPSLGVSKKKSTAIGMAFATAFVLTLASSSAYIINKYLLIPYDIEFLRTICYITLVAILVGLTEVIVYRTSPLLHRLLGIYLPLITTNCAVLGVMLIVTKTYDNLHEAVLYGVGAAFGFSLVLTLFASIRERLENATIAKSFQGAPIALITAGIMAIAFSGFSGI